MTRVDVCSLFILLRTQEVTIINFALGKHLVREDDLLTDQRGSLAYVSPDVISGECMQTKYLLATPIYTRIELYNTLNNITVNHSSGGGYS